MKMSDGLLAPCTVRHRPDRVKLTPPPSLSLEPLALSPELLPPDLWSEDPRELRMRARCDSAVVPPAGEGLVVPELPAGAAGPARMLAADVPAPSGALGAVGESGPVGCPVEDSDTEVEPGELGEPSVVVSVLTMLCPPGVPGVVPSWTTTVSDGVGATVVGGAATVVAVVAGTVVGVTSGCWTGAAASGAGAGAIVVTGVGATVVAVLSGDVACALAGPDPRSRYRTAERPANAAHPRGLAAILGLERIGSDLPPFRVTR